MSPVHFHPSISDESAPSTQSENIPQPAAYSAQWRKVKQTAAGRFAAISGRGQIQLEFKLKYKIGVHESQESSWEYLQQFLRTSSFNVLAFMFTSHITIYIKLEDLLDIR